MKPSRRGLLVDVIIEMYIKKYENYDLPFSHSISPKVWEYMK